MTLKQRISRRSNARYQRLNLLCFISIFMLAVFSNSERKGELCLGWNFILLYSVVDWIRFVLPKAKLDKIVDKLVCD